MMSLSCPVLCVSHRSNSEERDWVHLRQHRDPSARAPWWTCGLRNVAEDEVVELELTALRLKLGCRGVTNDAAVLPLSALLDPLPSSHLSSIPTNF